VHKRLTLVDLLVPLLVAATACGGSSNSIDGGTTADAKAPDGDGGGLPDATPIPDADIPGGVMRVYVGGGSSQINIYGFDPATLAFTPMGKVDAGANPSFLAFDRDRRWLVAVDESANKVGSYAIEPGSGALSKIDDASSAGQGPTHINLDRTGAYVLVANYTSGQATVLPISAAGEFGTPTAMVSPGKNAHEILVNTGNNTVYVPCLGDDRVAQYAFDVATGKLTDKGPVTLPDGAGPRHMSFAPNGQFAYVVNELDSTVSTFSIGGDGKLTLVDTISSLPDDFNGNNSGAEIEVHPSGKFVYSSNRGHNSIAIYSVGGNGKLTLIGTAPTGGSTPRHFSLTPGGTGLLVANQDSDTIFGLQVNAQTGALTSVGKLADIDAPQFVLAVTIPGK
jgi:6-phosphogluconolactonase